MWCHVSNWQILHMKHRKHSAGRIEAQVAWRDHWFQPAVRLSREKRCKGMQLLHSHSASHAQSTDWQRRPDSRVQHCRFQAGLLQCAVEWRTGANFWQTTVRPEQPGQSWGSTDASPRFHSLHWLPVRQWVTYKLAVLTYKVRTTTTPTYLS